MNYLLINGSPRNDGSTAKALTIFGDLLRAGNEVKKVCLQEEQIQYCKGCGECRKTGQCAQLDTMTNLFKQMEWADVIVLAAPSYWGVVPGQMKVMFDRSLPYCDMNDSATMLSEGKKGYAIAVQSDKNSQEGEGVIEQIRSYFGHMGIIDGDTMMICNVAKAEDVELRRDELKETFLKWIANAKTQQGSQARMEALFQNQGAFYGSGNQSELDEILDPVEDDL